ncbi:hypothetical protein vseg_021292 [Gypsophila vaccaria]
MSPALGEIDGALCNIQSGKESHGKGWTGHGAEFAGIKVSGNITGVHAKLAVFAPGEVKYGHYSAAYVSVESGEGGTRNQIKAGWVVNPCYYNDNEVHFFLYFVGDNEGFCWDTSCDDFVPTWGTDDLKLGQILTPSEVGQTDQNHVEIFIGQDDKVKMWFLRANSRSIGYWNGEYFSSLLKGATSTHIGGEVYTPRGNSKSPPMGSGTFKVGMKSFTSYVQQVKINSDEYGKGGIVPQNPEIIETRCYLVGDVGNPKWFDGFGFFYGGKGGTDQGGCVY